MSSALRIAYQTAIFAIADMRAVHSWRTWTFGWFARLVTQVIFFAMIGRFVGDAATMQYVLVGNVVVLVCLESMIVVLSMVDERSAGTLPLLMVAPTSHVPIYFGRGVHWLASGMASSLISWSVLPPLLGVPLPWPNGLYAAPMILVVGISSYCYACFLASFAIRWPGLEWIFLNLGYLPIMAFCGINVPMSFWPGWLAAAVHAFPVTNGLLAIRATLLVDRGVLPVVGSLAAEVLVGACWALLAAFSIRRVAVRGRMDGSLEFGT